MRENDFSTQVIQIPHFWITNKYINNLVANLIRNFFFNLRSVVSTRETKVLRGSAK